MQLAPTGEDTYVFGEHVVVRDAIDGDLVAAGETIRVAATVHTLGGLSAHADRDGLVGWYAAFRERPPLLLVHGESAAQASLADTLREQTGAEVAVPQRGQWLDLARLPRLTLGEAAVETQDRGGSPARGAAKPARRKERRAASARRSRDRRRH